MNTSHYFQLLCDCDKPEPEEQFTHTSNNSGDSKKASIGFYCKNCKKLILSTNKQKEEKIL
jgi:hypothetical protein